MGLVKHLSSLLSFGDFSWVAIKLSSLIHFHLFDFYPNQAFPSDSIPPVTLKMVFPLCSPLPEK